MPKYTLNSRYCLGPNFEKFLKKSDKNVIFRYLIDRKNLRKDCSINFIGSVKISYHFHEIFRIQKTQDQQLLQKNKKKRMLILRKPKMINRKYAQKKFQLPEYAVNRCYWNLKAGYNFSEKLDQTCLSILIIRIQEKVRNFYRGVRRIVIRV